MVWITNAIKGEEFNSNETFDGVVSSWFTGFFTSGFASGLSVKILYAADAVHTVVEDVIPAYMEMYDSLMKDE